MQEITFRKTLITTDYGRTTKSIDIPRIAEALCPAAYGQERSTCPEIKETRRAVGDSMLTYQRVVSEGH
jgi:hypothetical protein